MWFLFGAVVFLLLIACANVANLLLARSTNRSREFSVRSALGAGHARLLRQLMTEAITFTLLAGACGAILAFELVPLLTRFAPVNTPFLNDVALSGRGLMFALLVSLVVGLLLGFAPILRLSRGDRNQSLDLTGRGVISADGGRRLRSVLVAGEFALAMVLLTGAGLLVRSFIAVHNVNLGFHPQHVLTIQLSLPEAFDSQTRVLDETMKRIAALPDVRAVGGASNLFYLDEERTHALRLVEGHPPEPKSAWKPLVWTETTGDYFQAMGIPLVRGRFFGRTDQPNSPLVVIVNETLARRYWLGVDPIGKRIKGFDARGQHDDWLTVVGVVGDVRAGGLERPPFSQIYELQSQNRIGDKISNLVARTSGDPALLAAAVRSVIHTVDPDAVVSSISSMEVLLGQQEIQRRFQTWLVSVFSGMALLLAALGIFAVMHYSVAARTSEIGIRMAAGATPGDIAYLMLGNGTRLAVYGTIAGAIAAVWLTRAVAGLLFGVQPSDPISFISAALLLITVAVLGSWLPAIRASHTDPLNALRQA
jgi:predicted permease